MDAGRLSTEEGTKAPRQNVYKDKGTEREYSGAHTGRVLVRANAHFHRRRVEGERCGAVSCVDPGRARADARTVLQGIIEVSILYEGSNVQHDGMEYCIHTDTSTRIRSSGIDARFQHLDRR